MRKMDETIVLIVSEGLETWASFPPSFQALENAEEEKRKTCYWHRVRRLVRRERCGRSKREHASPVIVKQTDGAQN